MPAASSFVSINGTSFTLNGKPLRLRGVNTGNWMLIEHFMIGLPWTEYKMRQLGREILGDKGYHEFFDTFLDCSLTESDIRFIAENGMNFIRLPFNYRHFERDERPFEFLPDAFAYFDRVIGWCRTHGVYVMLDLHAAPGVQARDWNAESAYGEAMMWEQPHFMERTAALWKFIAARYRDEPQVAAYEILNEPLAPDTDTFHAFNMRVLRAIREVDTNHIVVAESNEWGKKISSLRDELFEDPLVAPSLHHYHSQFPPFDRLESYPGTWEGRSYGKAELAATLAPTYDYSRIQRPMIVGEFGIGRRWGNRAAQLAILDDLLGVFDDLGFSWTIWSYKDVGVMGLVSPKESTPWKQFQNLPEVSSIRDINFGPFRAEIQKMVLSKIPLCTEADFTHFWGQSMHHWHAVMLPKVLRRLKELHGSELAAMAESFRFESCEIDQEKLAVLRKHCE